MAKRMRRPASAATKIVRVPTAAAPIIKVSAPRAPARKAPKRRRSSRRSSNVGGGIVSNETVQMAIGGALYGFAVKSGLVAKLPEIPLLGRTGTAAILLDYWSRHGGGQMAHRAARAAAAIAGYQLGAEGKIQGLDDATTPGSMAGPGDDMAGYVPESGDGY
jgi:hypothetical protein